MKIMASAVLLERHPLERTVRWRIEEQLPPGLGALAHAVDETDELLLALWRGPDDDQQALRLVLEPGLNVDAVGPQVGIVLGR